MGIFVRKTRASEAARAPAYAPAHAGARWAGDSRTSTTSATWAGSSLELPAGSTTNRPRWWRPGALLLIGPAALLATATYGWRFNPGAWWLVTLLAAFVVRMAAKRTDRVLEQRFARAVGFLAVAWLSIAWQSGPYQVPLAVAMAALAPPLALCWGVYRWLRTLPTIDWPRGRAGAGARRGLLQVVREWRAAIRLQLRAMRQYRRLKTLWAWQAGRREIGLAESVIVAGHWSSEGPQRIRMDLEGGKTLADAQAALPQIEAMWKARAGALRVRLADSGLSYQVQFEWRKVAELAPLPTMLPWPGSPPKSSREPIRLGEWAGGRQVLIPIPDPATGRMAPHVQISGQSGWGKGSLVNCLMAETAENPFWEHWGIDAKEGVELGPWEHVFRELAEDDDQAVALLRKACEEMTRRLRQLRAAGRRFWAPELDGPLLMLLVDEWAKLGVTAKDLLYTLLTQGRAAGIWCVLSTQRPSAAVTGGTGQTGDARSQLGLMISCWMRPGDETLAFGEDARREGWRTDKLPAPGRALIRWQGRYDTPEPFQAYWLDDEAVALAAARAAVLRGYLPERADEAVDADVRDLPVRSLPPPAETALAQPGRPALHLVEPDPEDPLARLLGLLAAAPEEGVERLVMIRGTGMSDSWVDQNLKVLRAAGKAVKVGRARWRGAGPVVSTVATRSS